MEGRDPPPTCPVMEGRKGEAKSENMNKMSNHKESGRPPPAGGAVPLRGAESTLNSCRRTPTRSRIDPRFWAAYPYEGRIDPRFWAAYPYAGLN